jgi:hypothetical protein
VLAADGSGLNVFDLEGKVFASPTGLELTFAELSDLADKTLQVQDDEDPAILDKSEIAIAAFDCNFWLVSAPDPVLEHIESSFNDVSEEEPSSAVLRS